MSGQLSYNYQTPQGVAGSLYDISPYAIDSRINGETDSDKLKFGMGAVIGATPGLDVKVPTNVSKSAEFEGIVLTGFTNQMNTAGEVKIHQNQTVGILRWGRVWARVANGVTPVYGDQLFLIIDGADAGLFTNNDTDTLKINGEFIGTLGTGDIAPVLLYNQKN